MNYIPAALAILVAAAALYVIGARIAAMDSHITRHAAFLQYAVLGMGIFVSLLVPMEWGGICTAIGVLGYLVLGRKSWRNGAPTDIIRPEMRPVERRRQTDQGVRQ